MYTLNVLIPFDIIVDVDMGILKLIKYNYYNSKVFNTGILDGRDEDQQFIMYTRVQENPLCVLLRDNTDQELMDDMYRQFIEQEYPHIIKLSNNTKIADLIKTVKITKDQTIRIGIWCRTQEEADLLLDRGLVGFETFVEPDPRLVNTTKYDTIYVKSVLTLDELRNVEGKNIYIPNYNFNVANVPQFDSPLIFPDILAKYGKENEFFVFALYKFGESDEEDQD